MGKRADANPESFADFPWGSRGSVPWEELQAKPAKGIPFIVYTISIFGFSSPLMPIRFASFTCSKQSVP